MAKPDFKREHRWLYAPTAKGFSIVDVPPMTFLMIDGSGDPNTSQDYADAIQALYSAAYTVKFSSKNQLGKDYVIPPLEGLWSADDPSAFRRRAKHEWHWTMMIMQPDWITPAIITASIEAARRKKSLPALALLHPERFDEGRSVQIMHLGSYDAEGPILAQLHDDYLPSHGLVPNGRHHEIYLTDARKTAPDKLRTILRQPVKEAPSAG